MVSEMRRRRLATIPMVANEYPGVFSPASLRHHIFQASNRINSKNEVIPGNGLDRAIIRIGRKVSTHTSALNARYQGR